MSVSTGSQPRCATPTECTNPLTGQPEPCAPEVCIDEATGAHYECNSQPHCEYMCDDPDHPDLSTLPDPGTDTSTVPEYPDTDLTTLALTGGDWRGVVGTAGALALFGTVLYLTSRRSTRDRMESGR
jgi:hypothetical protein